MAVIPKNELIDRLSILRERVQRAAERSHRRAERICLLAAVKSVPVERIWEAVELGCRYIGENRVQEAAAKRDWLSAQVLRSGFKIEHHLIGALQTNKAASAVQLFDVIQSLDRIKLAEKLDRFALERGKRQRCLVEVNLAESDGRAGVSLSHLENFVVQVSRYSSLKIEGLMAVGPVGLGEKALRELYGRVRLQFQRLERYFGDRPVLSLGMSDDFEVAIEEGATMVRVGRLVFGKRP